MGTGYCAYKAEEGSSAQNSPVALGVLVVPSVPTALEVPVGGKKWG